MQLGAIARRSLLRLDDDWDEVVTVLLNATAECRFENDPPYAAVFYDQQERIVLACDIHRAALRFETDIHFFDGL